MGETAVTTTTNTMGGSDDGLSSGSVNTECSWDDVDRSSSSNSRSDKETIEQLRAELAKRDALLAKHEAKLAEHEAKLAEHEAKLAEQNKKLTEHSAKLVLATKIIQAVLQIETFLHNIKQRSSTEVLGTIKVLLRGAATLSVTELKEKAIHLAKSAMKKKPALAVAVLAMCASDDEGCADLGGTKIELLAHAYIRDNPELLLGNDALVELNGSQLDVILSDQRMKATEYTMFRILKEWDDKRRNREDHNTSLALQLSSHIQLELIDPTLLASEVRTADFISDTQLLDAFVKQAPLAKQSAAFNLFDKRRVGTKTYADVVSGRDIGEGRHVAKSIGVSSSSKDLDKARMRASSHSRKQTVK